MYKWTSTDKGMIDGEPIIELKILEQSLCCVVVDSNAQKYCILDKCGRYIRNNDEIEPLFNSIYEAKEAALKYFIKCYHKGNMADSVKDLTEKIIAFRNARDWAKFHNPKDVSLSLVLEASELMEHFQWKSIEEIRGYVKINKDEISKELADVFYWVLLMSADLNIDPILALKNKMEENEAKYPINKARGKHTKYNKL